MTITLNGTTGITTPAVTNNGAYTGDGISFADGTPSNTLVTDTSGNVGIGNAIPSSFDPAAKNLVIGTGSGNQGTTIYAGASSAGSIYFANGSSGANLYKGFIGYIHSSDAMQFATNNSERMRINSSGDLCIGTTTSSGMLTIRQRENTTTVFRLQDNNGNNRTTVLPSGYFGYMWGLQIYSNGGKAFLFTNASDSEVGSIVVNSGSTSFNTTSDYRLKENISPMTGALAKVSALKPCTYTWKADGSEGQGFIAHELAEVCPDAVTGEKDAVDAEGKIKPQAIDTSFLVATLTAAIQELKAELDTVKTELATLKGTA